MLLTRVRAGRLLGTRRMLAVGIRILMAVAFPRPVFRKDFDLNVGLFAALLRRERSAGQAPWPALSSGFQLQASSGASAGTSRVRARARVHSDGSIANIASSVA